MPSTQSILIESARCFDGARLLPDPVDLLLSDGRIEWLGSGSAPKDVRRIRAGRRLLMPGYSADLLLVDGDPLQEISILADKQRIKQVICRGRIAVERE